MRAPVGRIWEGDFFHAVAAIAAVFYIEGHGQLWHGAVGILVGEGIFHSLGLGRYRKVEIHAGFFQFRVFVEQIAILVFAQASGHCRWIGLERMRTGEVKMPGGFPGAKGQRSQRSEAKNAKIRHDYPRFGEPFY